MRSAVRVNGHSMRPTLEDGDVVLTQSTCHVAVGDIVLAAHPFKSSVTILKRLTAIDEDGRAELLGDAPDESSDSRSFGSMPLDQISGKVVCRLRRGDA
ncbi:MAG: nickel-type superoxide dismutase maturation protease [Pyrinomonadaceae bacterium]